MSAIPVIAIFDVGKTNKKFFLFDEAYKIVFEQSSQFDEIQDEDGFACDDVQKLQNWVEQTLTDALKMPAYDIKAVNFSAYGASFVLIDKEGKIIAPLYNYLKPYPTALSQQFYQQYGGEAQVATETASPVLGSLNSGLQLYRIKHQQPELFAKVGQALHLPQFLSFIVSKTPASDITSIGCHTQLWNFEKKQYHIWVEAEKIKEKLPPVLPSDEVIKTEFKRKNLVVGGGLHDSSAALIPYLTCFSEPFILISTGTWCITLNPFNSHPLTNEELKADCLCYMGFRGNPVKASRLFAGNEHEQQTKRLATHFGTSNDYFKKVKYDAVLTDILQAAAPFVADRSDGLQESVFSKRDLSGYKTYEEAYHQLIIDIIAEQKISTGRVIQNTPVKRIFVDGGFSHNPIYMHLLAEAFPKLEIFAASVAQATAVGAALAIHPHWNRQEVPGDLIELKFYALPHGQIV
jgi:sugar (pentulose or hexulose) kinase